MIKNWIRFVSFWAIFVILFSMTNAAMSMANDQWKSFYKIPRNSVDVLFIGNSHVYSTFQPQIINDIIPIHSFIVGIDAENVVISYYELKEVLKTQKPKVVVLETFVLDLDDTKKQGYLFEFLDAGMWDGNRTAIASRYLQLANFYTIFPSLRTRINWGKPEEFLNQFIARFNFFHKKDTNFQQSYSPKIKVISEAAYLAIDKIPTREFRTPIPDIQIYLDKFYNLCKENKIQLVFTTTPIKKITENYFPSYTPFDIKTYAKTNNIELITFAPTKFNHLHFSDPTHVDNFGSVIASIDMARELSRIMDLPVDQEKLNYYNSFVFSDYSIVHTGNDYVMNLVPDKKDTPLEYKCVVKGGNEIILESDWQYDNSCHFKITKNGDYSIEVSIKNPSGSYILNAVFYFTRTD